MRVLVIGTSVIDLFVSVDKDHYETDRKSVSFTLGDKVPISNHGMVIGGNGANVAVGLSRLGAKVALYTYLGQDSLAKTIEEKLTNERIELFKGVPRTQNTPIHLIFNFESDRIIFSDYPCENYEFKISKDKPIPEYIYLTSIGESWQSAYKQALDYADENNVAIALSPGSRQLKEGGELLQRAIAACAILLVNKEEAMRILNFYKQKTDDLKKLFSLLHAHGPEIVSITDGAHGAYASDKNNIHKISPFNDKKAIIQKTGAGDAFASAFFASILFKNSLGESMRWAAINAHSVMGHLGAQSGLLSKSELERLMVVNPSFQTEVVK